MLAEAHMGVEITLLLVLGTRDNPPLRYPRLWDIDEFASHVDICITSVIVLLGWEIGFSWLYRRRNRKKDTLLLNNFVLCTSIPFVLERGYWTHNRKDRHFLFENISNLVHGN